ncbi:delta-aminolevulinic acid dehydratase, chloroplastic-like [Olea europaea var. sylvestris]|uniref:delta-aminolevulinic acid dehydratase, chloroplastic-like n=1 Tax=Olea europaea var. sylvestris TaxID=158386 RepID=UPI000C1D3387|nr:delta-aminolevulinic acid dehydratase, chloroplastic-like [Olea europaea var. sylvestris]
MPGCYRLGWRHGLVEEVSEARDVGVNSIVLFPKVPDALKTSTGDEAYNENGLVPRTIRLLKDKYPDLIIYTDVALDPILLMGMMASSEKMVRHTCHDLF